mgnify:CR=1 FL=1
MTIEKINELKKIDIRSLERENLVDIRNIKIDDNMNASDKVKSFLAQVNNPFVQRIGDYIVVVGYNDNSNETIEDRMIYLAKKYSQIMV